MYVLPLPSFTCVPFWHTAVDEGVTEEEVEIVELTLDVLARTGLDSETGTSGGS